MDSGGRQGTMFSQSGLCADSPDSGTPHQKRHDAGFQARACEPS